jgi:redox-sensitive bicupin YhaK (pirin superfamily)
MESPLITFPLTTPWPTRDPFLFCVHHLDAFPTGNADLGPEATLQGRNIGSDFSGIDGWSMYHGDTVPGFPQHPHRGFETVTFVVQGTLDHSDSLGATARFGPGDSQWLTAGAGIVHSEMMPLVKSDAPNPTELFQIWLNLASEDKMADPHFSMTWDEHRPRVHHVDESGRESIISLVAGNYEGELAPAPPPRSWASRPESGVVIWHVTMQPGAIWTLPEAAADVQRSLYLAHGNSISTPRGDIQPGEGTHLPDHHSLEITASEAGATLLILGGTPINEPVAQYGPFVMNTRAELASTIEEYQRTQFGGWPWPTDDPNHGVTRDRFAVYPNGDAENPEASQLV